MVFSFDRPWAGDITEGTQSFSFFHDGLLRRYRLFVPPGARVGRPLPLVLALHGGGGNATLAESFFGLNPLAKKENFFVAYPEGSGRAVFGKVLGTWNAGSCCGPAHEKNVDDVGFLDRLIDEIARRFPVDRRRIYVTGMSNGAMMAYRLACALSEKIAAIAPVGAVGGFTDCQPTRPVPTLHIHGLRDPCAPYAGCQACVSCVGRFLRALGLPIRPKTGQGPPVPEFINAWRQRNGCEGRFRERRESGGAICRDYIGCRADVTLCAVPGLGHVWPGRDSYALPACQRRPGGYVCRKWQDIVGPLKPDFPANDIIWRFFRKHALARKP